MRPKRKTIDSELQKAESISQRAQLRTKSADAARDVPSQPTRILFGCAMGALPTTGHSDFARTAPRLEASRVIRVLAS